MQTEKESCILEASQQALMIQVGDFFVSGYSNNVPRLIGDLVSTPPVSTVTSDVKVSETNIPNLMHASLDLLIDGEKGIWYLTKDGYILPAMIQ